MLEELKTVLFSTAILLVVFFYGDYVLFKLLNLFKLKTEKQDIIAFIIFTAIVLTYPAFLSKLIAKILIKLGIFGWIVATVLYGVCYHRFKIQIQHKKALKETPKEA